MSCVQANVLGLGLRLHLRNPNSKHEIACQSSTNFSSSSISCLNVSATGRTQISNRFPRLLLSMSKYKRCDAVCGLSGGINLGGEYEGLPLESAKEATQKLRQKQPLEDLVGKQGQGMRKTKSVEELFWEQMKNREYYKGGGNKKPPKGGGGSGGSGGSDNWDFAKSLDELLQVILATIGFIFLYVCIVRGEELTLLSTDYVRYLFGAQTSPRLRRAFYKWEDFCGRVTRREAEITDQDSETEDWLE